MSRARRRFLVAYLFLVAVPVLCLIGVLKFGRGLSAPVSVNGTWAVTTAATRLSSGPCGEANSLTNLSLVISQSGKNFSVALDGPTKAHGEGSIDGTSVKAPLVLTRDAIREAGCATSQPLTLIATVDPKSTPRSLAGSLSVDGCSACAPVQFHAVLQPKPKAGAGH